MMTNKQKKYQREWRRKWRKNHKEKARIYDLRRRKIREERWTKEIKKIYRTENFFCQICNKPLSIFSGSRKNSVSFDHRKEITKIKKQPCGWLRGKSSTKENIRIFKKEHFGILCLECNAKIPTKNRKDWLKRITNYINEECPGEGLDIEAIQEELK